MARTLGRFAKAVSCVFSTSSTTFGDEIIIAKTSPSCSCIIGPYFLAKSLKDRCGREKTRWCKLPIRGSFHGPGGKLWLLALSFRYFPINNKDKQEYPS